MLCPQTVVQYYVRRLARIVPAFYVTAFLAYIVVHKPKENHDPSKVKLEMFVVTQFYFELFKVTFTADWHGA